MLYFLTQLDEGRVCEKKESNLCLPVFNRTLEPTQLFSQLSGKQDSNLQPDVSRTPILPIEIFPEIKKAHKNYLMGFRKLLDKISNNITYTHQPHLRL
jgi:hypothetical protein